LGDPVPVMTASIRSIIANMAKAFFCHAHEDAEAVDAIYRVIIARHPEHEPWLDKYEIKGGDDLLNKIADGMDDAEKFFIFLSRVTTTKSWVQRELKRAIMKEITGVNAEYIAPVKIGELDTLPDFLEHKRYIDLGRLTEDQWVAQFDSALTGTPARPTGGETPNLAIELAVRPDSPNVAEVWFQPRAWAEPISFVVECDATIVAARYIGTRVIERGMIMDSDFSGTNFQGQPREVREPNRYACYWPGHDVRAGDRVGIEIVLADGTDARTALRAGKATFV
jgi:hypothetical protein